MCKKNIKTCDHKKKKGKNGLDYEKIIKPFSIVLDRLNISKIRALIKGNEEFKDNEVLSYFNLIAWIEIHCFHFEIINRSLLKEIFSYPPIQSKRTFRVLNHYLKIKEKPKEDESTSMHL